MNKILKTTILFAIFFSQISCFAQDKCIITGSISGIEKDTEIYLLRKVGEYGYDTIKRAPVTKGQFKMELDKTLFNEFYDLRFKDIRGPITVIAEKGEIKITGDVSKLYFSEIEGPAENVRFKQYQKAIAKISNERDDFVFKRTAPMTQEEKVAKFKEIEKRINNYKDSLITNYPQSIVSLFLAKIPLMMLKHYQIDSILKPFTPYFKEHPYYKEMKERADVLRKVAPGAVATDFNVFTPNGGKISLSSFKGKYVLLDFWASWCVPCREENKHTKQIFEKYHKYGLEVISFSLDSEKDKWINAIDKDGLIWHNASDLIGGVKSPVAQAYGIDGIPAIWIINPNGVIIAEGIRGDALDKFCEKLFLNK